MNKCSNCGYINDDDAAICGNCGTPLNTQMLQDNFQDEFDFSFDTDETETNGFIEAEFNDDFSNTVNNDSSEYEVEDSVDTFEVEQQSSAEDIYYQSSQELNNQYNQNIQNQNVAIANNKKKKNNKLIIIIVIAALVMIIGTVVIGGIVLKLIKNSSNNIDTETTTEINNDIQDSFTDITEQVDNSIEGIENTEATNSLDSLIANASDGISNTVDSNVDIETDDEKENIIVDAESAPEMSMNNKKCIDINLGDEYKTFIDVDLDESARQNIKQYTNGEFIVTLSDVQDGDVNSTIIAIAESFASGTETSLNNTYENLYYSKVYNEDAEGYKIEIVCFTDANINMMHYIAVESASATRDAIDNEIDRLIALYNE